MSVNYQSFTMYFFAGQFCSFFGFGCFGIWSFAALFYASLFFCSNVGLGLLMMVPFLRDMKYMYVCVSFWLAKLHYDNYVAYCFLSDYE